MANPYDGLDRERMSLLDLAFTLSLRIYIDDGLRERLKAEHELLCKAKPSTIAVPPHGYKG